MPGRKRCAYMQCMSMTKNYSSVPVRFFKFPIHNQYICDLWIANCANKELRNLTKSALRSRLVCEKHFEKFCFKNLSRKSRLEKNAVPTLPCVESEEEIKEHFISISTCPSNISTATDASSPVDPLDPGPQNELMPLPSTSRVIPTSRVLSTSEIVPNSGVVSTSGVIPKASASTASSEASQPSVVPQTPVQASLESSPTSPVIKNERPAPNVEPELDTLPEDESSISVKWNTYAANMSYIMPSLLEDEKFVDVTLACDGEYIKCHKVILGACSPYFEELLTVNPCQHPIILMKDFQFWEIQAIVDFIYRGVVNIPRHQLPKLLQVASALQIKGLTGSNKTASDSCSSGGNADNIAASDQSTGSRLEKGCQKRKKIRMNQRNDLKTSTIGAKRLKIRPKGSSRSSLESHTSDESSNQSDVSQLADVAMECPPECPALESICIKEETLIFDMNDSADCPYRNETTDITPTCTQQPNTPNVTSETKGFPKGGNDVTEGDVSRLEQIQVSTLPECTVIKQEAAEENSEPRKLDPLDIESGVS